LDDFSQVTAFKVFATKEKLRPKETPNGWWAYETQVHHFEMKI